MDNDRKMQSYKDLEIYQLGKQLAVKVHKMTLTELPKFEMYEEGSQIRRSSKSIVSNTVEGYGRKRYKNEFVKFSTYAIASCDETKAHLEMLHETDSLQEREFQALYADYEKLGSKLYKFRHAVIEKHKIFD